MCRFLERLEIEEDGGVGLGAQYCGWGEEVLIL